MIQEIKGSKSGQNATDDATVIDPGTPLEALKEFGYKFFSIHLCKAWFDIDILKYTDCYPDFIPLPPHTLLSQTCTNVGRSWDTFSAIYYLFRLIIKNINMILGTILADTLDYNNWKY